MPMYSQQDLDDAVASGVITAEAADALRTHVERQRATPIADEEQFRLLTGFNDIFVAIAAAILLFAVGWIGQSVGQATGLAIDHEGPSFLAPLFVAATSWCLAMFFTARRRMALPSILLLLGFVGGVFATVAFALALGIGSENLNDNATLQGIVAAASAAIAAIAAWLHWRTFHVPITIAAGAASVAGIAIGLLIAALGPHAEDAKNIILSLVLVLGIGVFLFAMWWDSSDRARITRRSDVAFWLHLLAAPMIVHPIFAFMGVTNGAVAPVEGVAVIVLYLALGVTAVAIDRRALLVSALAYVLWALADLFKRFGAVELNIALTALVIGSALLLLSAFWHQARAAVVKPLPEGLRDRLPLIHRPAFSQQAA
jgi:MFS family permease